MTWLLEMKGPVVLQSRLQPILKWLLKVRSPFVFQTTLLVDLGPPETYKLLIYNQHQPSSDERPFPATIRIAFCNAIRGDVIGYSGAAEHA